MIWAFRPAQKTLCSHSLLLTYLHLVSCTYLYLLAWNYFSTLVYTTGLKLIRRAENRAEQWCHSERYGSIFSIHFPHRLFLNNLYKDEYAVGKANSGGDESRRHVLGHAIKQTNKQINKKNGRIQHFCFIFLHKNIWLSQNIVCVVMIRHDPTWLCPRRTRLYINYLGKVYGKNALDFHFWKPSDVTTAQLYRLGYTAWLVKCNYPTTFIRLCPEPMCYSHVTDSYR